MTEFQESFYRPCVGILVVNPEGKVWVGQRAPASDTPLDLLDYWQMPQGGIDPGEDPERAAFRELYEETSIRSVRLLKSSHTWYFYDLPPSLRGKVWGGKYHGQRQKWFALAFSGDESEISLEPQGGHKPEFRSWKWCDFSEVSDQAVPFKRDVYQSVMEEFSDIFSSFDGR